MTARTYRAPGVTSLSRYRVACSLCGWKLKNYLPTQAQAHAALEAHHAMQHPAAGTFTREDAVRIGRWVRFKQA